MATTLMGLVPKMCHLFPEISQKLFNIIGFFKSMRKGQYVCDCVRERSGAV